MRLGIGSCIAIVAFLLGGGSAAPAPPPNTITAPVVHGITGTAAVIEFDTVTPSRVRLLYDRTAGAPDSLSTMVPLSTEYRTRHQVALRDLLPGQPYAFRVDAVDRRGQVVVRSGNFQTLDPDPAAPLDYTLLAVGPRHVTQGHTLYVAVLPYLLAGRWQPAFLDTSGLPPGSSLEFPFETLPSRRTRPVLYGGRGAGVVAALTAGPNTPIRKYSLTFSLKLEGLTRQVVHEVVVEALPRALPRAPAEDIPLCRGCLRAWERAMLEGGRKWCGWNGGGRGFDYDEALVWHNVASFTGDPKWFDCVAQAHAIYRDAYVLRTGGGVAAYYVYPWGLYHDYQRTGNEPSRQAALLLAQRSAYAHLYYGVSDGGSREVAYILGALQVAARLGAGDPVRLERALDYALGHIDQWFVSKTAGFVKPFMVGLTLKALIDLYEDRPDPRIPVAVQAAADGLFECCWMPRDRSFVYSTSHPPEGDVKRYRALSLLIAPAYAWLWAITGNRIYADRGDAIFSGALDGTLPDLLWAQKAYNQSFYASPNYIRWRQRPHSTAQ